MLSLAVIAIPNAGAQTFSVVHNFTGGSDGGGPLNGFTSDGVGNLYGTTSSGGTTNHGVVFRLNKEGVETVLYNFKDGSDGAYPQGALIKDKAGNFYGTTLGGGAAGTGTVFGITAKGKEQVLYSFAGGADGVAPEAGLAFDAAGNLYGTTTAGGANGTGTVFKLTVPQKGAKWTKTVLYSFGSAPDGTTPVAGLTFDKAGNLYGTTSAGGTYGYGTIFQLIQAGGDWTENIIHEFQDGDDGAVPFAGLISDKAGNFYGAAGEGGTGGGGTVFELKPANGAWTFTVLNSQAGWNVSGTFRNLMMDASGNLYGTTHCDGAPEAGTVYELTPASGSWSYTLLYTFTGGSDGLYSFSNLVLEQGKLYGTTNEGGSDDAGVIFEVTL
ncbi:MAG: choice-of-anchor tandem repeat GloVer-containing protein [Candidatus Sulfotelmatobacter sp.]